VDAEEERERAPPAQPILGRHGVGPPRVDRLDGPQLAPGDRLTGLVVARIEAEAVPHEQHGARPARGGHDRLGIYDGGRDRLLDQDVAASRERQLARLPVERVGRAHADRIQVVPPEQLREVRVVGGCAGPLGQLPGGRFPHVADGDELDVRQARIDPRVPLAHEPRPDHRDPDRSHAGDHRTESPSSVGPRPVLEWSPACGSRRSST
jgi:hypothetical protein